MADALDLYNAQQINIGGVDRYIATYDDIIRLEPTDMNTGLGGVSKEGYMSMVCYNLGFKARPVTDEWLTKSLPIENENKTESISLPQYLKNRDLIIRDDMSLADVLHALYLWGRGPIETGLLVDTSQSWQYPSEDEIKYCLQNKIFIKRSCVLTEKCHWANTNILTRRLHNLCPHIDADYFSNCIVNFNEYAAMIPLKDPVSVFVCGIVNPDLLLSMIRSSEMEGAAVVNEKYHGYISLRPDYETAIEFYKIFTTKLEKLSSIFKEHGARGIVMMSYRQILNTFKDNSLAITISSTKPDTDTDRLAQLDTIDEKRQYVDNVELNDTNLGFLYRYLDQDSLPPELTKVTQRMLDGVNMVTINNPELGKFLKRVYCIFESISTNRNYWLDDSVKWIFSKPMYASPNRFGLYNRKLDLFLLAYPDLTYSLEEPLTAIKIYKDKYDEEIILNPDEIGDARETPRMPNVSLSPGPDPRFEVQSV